MAITKKAQQELYKELSKFEIKAHQPPEYNGYTPDNFGLFQNNLQQVYNSFVDELNDNFTETSRGAFMLYLYDIQTTFVKTYNDFLLYKKEEIHETLKDNAEMFRQNQLGLINHFMVYQSDIFSKVIAEIQQKFTVYEKIPASSSNENQTTKKLLENETQLLPKFDRVINSNLSRKDLTVLWYLMVECEFFEFQTDNKYLADFIQNNFKYKTTGKDEYNEMKSIEELLSQIKKGDTNAYNNQNNLLAKLRDTFKSVETQIIDALQNVKMS